jgi:hypothetical protein
MMKTIVDPYSFLASTLMMFLPFSCQHHREDGDGAPVPFITRSA